MALLIDFTSLYHSGYEGACIYHQSFYVTSNNALFPYGYEKCSFVLSCVYIFCELLHFF